MSISTHQRHRWSPSGICEICEVVRWKYLKQRKLDHLAKLRAGRPAGKKRC
jgi:hypothetical protein